MNVRFRILAAGLLLATTQLGGCGVLGGRPQPVTYYQLELAAPPALAAAPRAAVLLVEDPLASNFLQAAPLAYSRAAGTLAYYQYARWAEPPAGQLGRLLRQRIETAALYQAVGAMDSGMRGDYQLHSRLLEFHHDATQAPGTARVVLEMELVRRQDARLIARERFSASAPAHGHNASGAVAGLNAASARILDDAIAWLARVQPLDDHPGTR